MVKALDKAKKEYYGTRAKLEMPGWVLGFISLRILLTGILLRMNSVIAIGILILSLSVFFILFGRSAHQGLLRK